LNSVSRLYDFIYLFARWQR